MADGFSQQKEKHRKYASKKYRLRVGIVSVRILLDHELINLKQWTGITAEELV